jgi:hypothetical protein
MGEKKYLSHTHLDSDRIRLTLMSKKHPHTYTHQIKYPISIRYPYPSYHPSYRSRQNISVIACGVPKIKWGWLAGAHKAHQTNRM